MDMILYVCMRGSAPPGGNNLPVSMAEKSTPVKYLAFTLVPSERETLFEQDLERASLESKKKLRLANKRFVKRNKSSQNS